MPSFNLQNLSFQLSPNWRLPYGLFLLAGIALVLDLFTKSLASNHLVLHEPNVITSFFNFTLRHNYGAAFSFLSDAGGWQRYFFTAIASIMSVVLIIWLMRLPVEKKAESIAIALILSGALGNLYDRVTLGYVVDFIEVHYKTYYWPAFNIADSAICIGACILVLDAFKTNKA